MLCVAQVSELMTMAVTAVPPVVPVRQLVDTLRKCNHQVCPCSYNFTYPDREFVNWLFFDFRRCRGE